jgi:hypothetical protein
MAPTRSPRRSAWRLLAIFVAGAALSVGGIAAARWANPAVKAPAPAAAPASIVAVVNGEPITELDIAGALLGGVDRANAVNGHVNKALAAQMATKQFAADAEVVARAAVREALAQLYSDKRAQAVRAALTDAEIKAFYEANVKPEIFAGYKVSALVTQDPKEADEIAAALLRGKAKEHDARFRPLVAGDGYALLGNLPAGLGPVVRELKAGGYSRPLMTREGILILRLDDIRQNPPPDLAAMTPRIKEALTVQKVNAELAKARQHARIELKS